MKDNLSPLHLAILSGDLETVQRLMDYKLERIFVEEMLLMAPNVLVL